MKNTIIIIALLVGTLAYSQRPNHEKIKAYKTAHLTQQLDLSSPEAEKFWPIYNDFEAKMKTLRKKNQTEVYEVIKENGINELNDSEANKILDKIIAIKTEELAHRKKLLNDLKGILSPIKILKLERAEENFKRKLLKRLKKHRGNGSKN